jgi:Uma2 family endonuclease
MNVVVPRTWTVDRFLDWAAAQEEPYEFDGTQPVAMNGGNARHSGIVRNILTTLRTRLRGSSCACYGPSLAVQTVGTAIRYPDALVTNARFSQSARLAPGVVAVFEVVSPHSGRLDREVKAAEYRAVPTILHYVIVESARVEARVLSRADGTQDWTVQELTSADDVIDLPEAGAQLSLADIYEDIEFDPPPG